jgi:hypothetical protein
LRRCPNVFTPLLPTHRVPEILAVREDFDKIRESPLERPNDPQLLDEEYVGYIDDVVAELEKYSWFDDEDDASESALHELGLDDDGSDIDLLRPQAIWRRPIVQEPVRNRLRHVGRNDRCLCGSGRKFKKCCLTS